MLVNSRSLLVGRNLKLSPLIRVGGFRQHVFKWGIGSDHSLRNRLRQLPPTVPHPKEKTIPLDYFTHPDENIKWCKVNEQWEVFWYEYEKLNAKPFPVRKFGVERSKNEAVSFYHQLKSSGRMHLKPNYVEKDAPNVFWDDRMQAWFATYTDETGKPISAGFGAGKWGYQQAREKAIARSKLGIEGQWLAQLCEK